MKKKAIITGITGQDGSYLAELLLSKDYEVVGVVRRSSTNSTERIHPLLNSITLVEGDVTDLSCMLSIITKHQPDEVYNLAAQSFVKDSFTEPAHTTQVNAIGTLNILEAVRLGCPTAKVYQASTSEMFGKVHESPQSETTRFHPRSPYGTAKTFAHYLVQNYRESYNMFACCGILFNHESPRRGEEFVTKKITKAVARIHKGLQKELRLGNLDAQRDWGYAKDFVEAMWLMLQQDEPEDFVIATGQTHTIRKFCDMAFSKVGLNYEDYVVIDPEFYRPAEVELLLGDASKAKELLGWEPKHTLEELVDIMLDYDLEETQ